MERLIGNIYDALDDDDALSALPNLIAKEIGARSCTIQTFNSAFELEESWLNHFHDSMYEFYCEHKIYRHDEWTNTNLNIFGLDKTARHTDYFPLEDFRSSFFYNEFIRHFGDDSAFCLGFISSRRDGGYHVVGLQKGILDKDFTDEQVAQHEAIRPHVSRMLALRRKLLLSEKDAMSALAGIQTLEDAYLVILPDCSIVFANSSAEALLKEAKLLKVRAGRLELASPFDDAHLRRCLHDVLTRTVDGRTAFVAYDKTGREWRFTLAPRAVDGRTMVLVWIDRGQAGATAPERIQQLYGLTSAEVPILLALSKGRTAQETAELQGVSVATIRSHIQHIYSKTGVHKASQLATLVASLPKVRSGE